MEEQIYEARRSRYPFIFVGSALYRGPLRVQLVSFGYLSCLVLGEKIRKIIVARSSETFRRPLDTVRHCWILLDTAGCGRMVLPAGRVLSH